jgi:hypothetical protein
MNSLFRDLQGGLFAEVINADVGDGAGKLMEQGADIMAWADPFFTDPSLPDSGLLYAMMSFIKEGDEELIPEPSYPSNTLNAKLLGGRAVTVPLYYKDNYQVRIEKRNTPYCIIFFILHPPITLNDRKNNRGAQGRILGKLGNPQSVLIVPEAEGFKVL